MSLYLVRHGHSLPKDEDPEQGLSDTGRADTRRLAEVAGGYQVPVSIIQHSTKKRARETAAIFKDVLNPGQGLEEIKGLKPMDDILPVADSLSPDGNIMLVSHLPFLSRLTAWLVTGNADIPVIVFQNSGIVCLDKVDPGGWTIQWALMPYIS
ncbi:MAG: phosphohistidine phosphatase SixA [Desulfosudaceae bacterium]